MKMKCDNCDKIMDENESSIYEIDDLVNRIDPGGEVPAGQCTDCGSLAYQLKEPLKKELLTKSDYQNAVWAQSACNLSGIVFAFAKVIQKICDEAVEKEHGTDWKNEHPICRLYAEQILLLTRNRDYFPAYQECLKIAEGK